MSETSAPARRWRTPFFTVWTGQAVSLLGSQMVQFALVWWLTTQTGSATVLATSTLVAMLPGILLGPFAGALVDRWDRKRVMVLADGGIALATLGLILLFVTGNMQVWHVYLIGFVRSVGGAFHWPAMQASTSLMVPKEHLSRVAGANQTLQGAMNIVAPPLGALLIAALPLHAIMAIDVSTACVAIVCLLAVTIPQPETRSVSEGFGPAAVWTDVRAGFRYMLDWRGGLIMCAMATVVNLLLNPAFSLMPILVTRHFGGGALELGGIESAWGFGVVAGGIALGVWGGFRRRIVTTIVGLVGMGLGTLLIGLTPSGMLPVAVAAMAFAGIMNPITNGPVFAIMQALVPADMQGRVFTMLSSLTAAMSPLGLLAAGPVADAVGVQTWFVVGGAACILMAAGAAASHEVMHLEDFSPARPAVVSEAVTPSPAEDALR